MTFIVNDPIVISRIQVEEPLDVPGLDIEEEYQSQATYVGQIGAPQTNQGEESPLGLPELRFAKDEMKKLAKPKVVPTANSIAPLEIPMMQFS